MDISPSTVDSDHADHDDDFEAFVKEGEKWKNEEEFLLVLLIVFVLCVTHVFADGSLLSLSLFPLPLLRFFHPSLPRYFPSPLSLLSLTLLSSRHIST